MPFADQYGAALPPKLRFAALGGVIGPAAFIGGWTASAAITSDTYSSIDDAISRLAAVGADSRMVMNVAFIGFGIALPVYAVALRRAIGGRAWVNATAAAIATLAVAATPLDRSSAIDTAHAVAAGIGYIALERSAQVLHGRRTYDESVLRSVDVDAMARLAIAGGSEAQHPS